MQCCCAVQWKQHNSSSGCQCELESLICSIAVHCKTSDTALSPAHSDVLIFLSEKNRDVVKETFQIPDTVRWKLYTDWCRQPYWLKWRLHQKDNSELENWNVSNVIKGKHILGWINVLSGQQSITKRFYIHNDIKANSNIKKMHRSLSFFSPSKIYQFSKIFLS